MLQQLRQHTSNAGGVGLILGRGTKILQAMWPKNTYINKDQVVGLTTSSQ